MSYCLPVWCLISIETWKPVKLLYNRAYKICVNFTYRSYHCTAFEKVSALNLDNYHKWTSLKLYYHNQHNLSPSLISLIPRLLNTRKTQITCAITNRENPLPRYKNNYGYWSFFYSGTVNWNDIPLNQGFNGGVQRLLRGAGTVAAERGAFRPKWGTFGSTAYTSSLAARGI